MACEKVCFETRSRANEARRTMRGKGMRAYQCPDCAGCWHLGHLPRSVRRGRITAREIYGGDAA